jgi:hypothetical protein
MPVRGKSAFLVSVLRFGLQTLTPARNLLGAVFGPANQSHLQLYSHNISLHRIDTFLRHGHLCYLGLCTSGSET